MKNMKLINLIFAISSLAVSQAALASMKVTVNGMVCSFCAQGIEKSILKLDETKAVLVDLKNKVVIVEAKEGKTLNEKLISEEIKDSGYDVVKIESVLQSVAEIKAELKARK